MKLYITVLLIFILACTDVSRNSDIELGQEIFEDKSLYKTDAEGNSLACVTCHPSGNMNNAIVADISETGLTRKWNTPSLWNVAHTAPYLWGGEQEDLKGLTKFLMEKFMNANADITDKKVNAVVAYMSSIPSPLSPFKNTDGSFTNAQLRGKVLFEGRGNCVSCHGGTYFTDNKKWFVNAEADSINTPSLLGMWDTAPYWHNGKMATIKDVLNKHKWIVGDTPFKVTPPFSDEEKNDLEAYLNAL